MRYASFVAAAFMVAAATATPVDVRERDYVTEYKTVQVTAYANGDGGYPAAPAHTPVRYGNSHRHKHHHKHGYEHWWKYSTSYAAPSPAPEEKPKPYVPKVSPTHKPRPAATTPPSSSGPSAGGFGDSCVETHNKYRAEHGAGPLEWDQTMADFAKKVSATCVFQHSGGPYGENLAAGYSSPEAAITAWYDEGSQYNYGAADFSEQSGHFTQVVWKSAKKVGCAQVDCNGTGGTPGSFFTCEYDTGNVIGEFSQNVLQS